MSKGPDTPTPRISPKEREKAWAYAREYYPDPKFIEDFEMLAHYVPDVAYGYFTLRQGAFNTAPDAALPRKTKELMLVAMGLAARKTNPPPLGHTRLAIEAGASVAEIAEVVSLAIMYCGIITFHESGRHVLHAAEEFARSRADGSGA